MSTVAYYQSSASGNLTILKFPKVRKQVYIVGNSEPRENIGILNELIHARDELAKVMCLLHTIVL
jgi:intermediate peptidase